MDQMDSNRISEIQAACQTSLKFIIHNRNIKVEDSYEENRKDERHKAKEVFDELHAVEKRKSKSSVLPGYDRHHKDSINRKIKSTSDLSRKEPCEHETSGWSSDEDVTNNEDHDYALPQTKPLLSWPAWHQWLHKKLSTGKTTPGSGGGTSNNRSDQPQGDLPPADATAQGATSTNQQVGSGGGGGCGGGDGGGDQDRSFQGKTIPQDAIEVSKKPTKQGDGNKVPARHHTGEGADSENISGLACPATIPDLESILEFDPNADSEDIVPQAEQETVRLPEPTGSTPKPVVRREESESEDLSLLSDGDSSNTSDPVEAEGVLMSMMRSVSTQDSGMGTSLLTSPQTPDGEIPGEAHGGDSTQEFPDTSEATPWSMNQTADLDSGLGGIHAANKNGNNDQQRTFLSDHVEHELQLSHDQELQCQFSGVSMGRLPDQFKQISINESTVKGQNQVTVAEVDLSGPGNQGVEQNIRSNTPLSSEIQTENRLEPTVEEPETISENEAPNSNLEDIFHSLNPSLSQLLGPEVPQDNLVHCDNGPDTPDEIQRSLYLPRVSLTGQESVFPGQETATGGNTKITPRTNSYDGNVGARNVEDHSGCKATNNQHRHRGARPKDLGRNLRASGQPDETGDPFNIKSMHRGFGDGGTVTPMEEFDENRLSTPERNRRRSNRGRRLSGLYNGDQGQIVQQPSSQEASLNFLTTGSNRVHHTPLVPSNDGPFHEPCVRYVTVLHLMEFIRNLVLMVRFSSSRLAVYRGRVYGRILDRYEALLRIIAGSYDSNQWVIMSSLGSGGQGSCYMAFDLNTNHKFCVKKINPHKFRECEVENLVLCQNIPGVVDFYGVLYFDDDFYILMELLTGPSLRSWMEHRSLRGSPVSSFEALLILKQVLQILRSLLDIGIIHDDIKAENLVLVGQQVDGNPLHFKMIDFGMSKSCAVCAGENPEGTSTHWSPEKCRSEGYSHPVDIYASLITFVHLLLGYLPRGEFNHLAVWFKTGREGPPRDHEGLSLPDGVQDMITRGLHADPQERATACDLLKHIAFDLLAVDPGNPIFFQHFNSVIPRTNVQTEMSTSQSTITSGNQVRALDELNFSSDESESEHDDEKQDIPAGSSQNPNQGATGINRDVESHDLITGINDMRPSNIQPFSATFGRQPVSTASVMSDDRDILERYDDLVINIPTVVQDFHDLHPQDPSDHSDMEDV